MNPEQRLDFLTVYLWFPHAGNDALLRQIIQNHIGASGPVSLNPDIPDKQGKQIEKQAAGRDTDGKHLPLPVPVQKKRKAVAFLDAYTRMGLSAQRPYFPEIPDAQIHLISVPYILQIP